MMDIEAMKALVGFTADMVGKMESCLARVTFYGSRGFVSAGYTDTDLALCMIDEAKPEWGLVSQIEVRYRLQLGLDVIKEIYLKADMIKCDGIRYKLC